LKFLLVNDDGFVTKALPLTYHTLSSFGEVLAIVPEIPKSGGVQLSVVIASFLFPCIPLGASSGLGAFGATPKTPHLECLDTLGESPNLKSLINNELFTPHRVAHQYCIFVFKAYKLF